MLRHAFGLVLVACTSDGLDISGSYDASFGGTYAISDAEIVITYDEPDTWIVADFDNVEQVVVAQNGDDNAYFPGLWSRFDWVELDGDLWICQEVFDAASQADAEAAAPADGSDPAMSGCGTADYGFTMLTPR